MGESSLDNRDLCFSLKMLQRSKEDTKKREKRKQVMLTHKELAIKVTLPVFSFISHKTLKRAGFILWQLSACFLKNKQTKNKGGMGGQDTTFQISIQTSGNTTELAEIPERLHFPNISQLIVLPSMQKYRTYRSQSMEKIYIC